MKNLYVYEFFNVQEILAFSTKIEKDFCTEFEAILSKYQINSTPVILNELKQLYKYNCAPIFRLGVTIENDILLGFKPIRINPIMTSLSFISGGCILCCRM